MSQSSTEAGNQSLDYVRGWQALYELARRGRSFSGQERHCAFLNLGGDEGFADASAAASLDFDDDGRAVNANSFLPAPRRSFIGKPPKGMTSPQFATSGKRVT